ncbi:hypothetical protein GOP47_0002073 [Adiantum capillus-veneris]|uniref:Uncharacterized protein n=1 Tax=Adiantum capillus-veneris TaxID=13818 RepID=A0A9D4ZRA2_ADICA|nr:hypothetical protein GOP47_0002073 [Adiantum capillus-veneris]
MEAMASSLKPPACSFVKVDCSARGLEEVKPLQAPKLQDKFGSENLQFSDVAGRTVAELKLASGTSVRLLLAEARITSYSCRLWHGSCEEMLYTDVSESSVNGIDRSVHGATPQQFFVTGGMAPSLAHSLDPHISLCNNNRSVQSVAVDPKEHVQVTLRCANENRDDCHFKLHNIITLTNQGLASTLTLTNKDRRPLRFTASVSTAFAIRSSQAVCCVGLDGCEYFSPSEAALKAAQGNQNGSFFEKLKSEGNSNEDQMHWFTEKPGEIISVTNGVHKVYSNPPNKMRITDEVRV